jgi:predicted transcriptional regulator of viral defense system
MILLDNIGMGVLMDKNNDKIGSLELRFISYFQMAKKRIVKSGDLENILRITKQRENNLLSKLSAKKIIIRLQRGLYLLPKQISAGSFTEIHEYEIIKYYMEEIEAKYLISGFTAIYYYGFTTQIPNTICVYNNKIYGEKQIAGKTYKFIKTSVKRLKGAEKINTENNCDILFASKARLLIDCIYDWKRYNSIPAVYGWIKQEIMNDETITEKLINNANRYGNKSVQRRLGYLLETLKIESSQLMRLQRKLGKSKSLIPFNPTKKITGKIDKKWGIVINE